MSHRNFDQALEGSQLDLTDITFDLGSREWHLGLISDFMLMKWVSQTADAGRADLLTKIMTRFTIEEEQDDWVEFLTDGRWYEVPGEAAGSGEEEPEPERKHAPPPSMADYVQLINWSIEQHSERRPTTPS